MTEKSNSPVIRKFTRFVVQLLILSVIISALAYVGSLILPEGFITIYVPLLIAFFFLVTAGVHYLLLRASVHQARKFVTYFMLATFIKFMVYILVVFTFAYFNREDLISFVITFFILYILFTVFEVVAIVRHQ